MTNREDLTDLLKRWPYDPEKYVRDVVGSDGRRKLQVRFPMGVEQYELDGRPDGLRPRGYESYLQYFLHLRDLACDAPAKAAAFKLAIEAADLLREECMIYYYRFDLLHMRKDFERAVRDSGRNLLAYDFVRQYAENSEDRESMEVYRPYTLRIHFGSRALLASRRRKFDEALRQVNYGLEALEDMPEVDAGRWSRERRRAVAYLIRLRKRLHRQRPLTLRQRLQRDLQRAVDREDYENAALLRDRIAELPSPRQAQPADEKSKG